MPPSPAATAAPSSSSSIQHPTSPTAPHAHIYGSCHCGRIEIVLSTLPLSINYCHCTQCQQLSGSHFLAFGMWHVDAVKYVYRNPEGRMDGDAIEHVQYSSMAVRMFCATCRSNLGMRYDCEPDSIYFTLGILMGEGCYGGFSDKGQGEIERCHIFLDPEQPVWGFKMRDHDDGVARYRGNPPEFVDKLQVWEDAGRPRWRTDFEGCKIRTIP